MPAVVPLSCTENVASDAIVRLSAVSLPTVWPGEQVPPGSTLMSVSEPVPLTVPPVFTVAPAFTVPVMRRSPSAISKVPS